MQCPVHKVRTEKLSGRFFCTDCGESWTKREIMIHRLVRNTREDLNDFRDYFEDKVDDMEKIIVLLSVLVLTGIILTLFIFLKI